jgi:tetraacyldisaccharide 4'-kinase
MACARYFADQGNRVLIISRGYNRREKTPVQVVSDGERVILEAKEAGDEPYLMARKCACIPVIVGRNRYDAAMEGINNFSPDIILLDDGFQHMALYRDLDVVLLDAENPFSNGYLLPRGHLREPQHQIKRAHIVCLVRRILKDRDADYPVGIPCNIDGYLLYQPVSVVDRNLEHFAPLEFLDGKTLIAFCGIGNPEPFREWLNRSGAVLKELFVFDDHHEYTVNDVHMLINSRNEWGAELVLTTEKDIIKIGGHDKDLEILALNMELMSIRTDSDQMIFATINDRIFGSKS